MTVILRQGDCREVIKTIVSGSIAAIVTDPPYSLVSIQKRFGKPGSAPAKEGTDGLYRRASAGFMGQQWDTGEVAHDPAWWAECYRVLKPGAHLVAFGGTRTWHRMVCAIEDAGFEIRDSLCWLYGTGFPKSHDVSKGIDTAAGVERGVVAEGPTVRRMRPGADQNKDGSWEKLDNRTFTHKVTAPVTEGAVKWQGWGTALKPAFEPIVLARKPLGGTVVETVLRHGTGAINIDACRVTLNGDYKSGANGQPSQTGLRDYYDQAKANQHSEIGRWPANVVHDGSDEVVGMFPRSAGQQGDVKGTEPSAKTTDIYGEFIGRTPFNKRAGEPSAERRYTEAGSTNFAALPGERRGDAGSAARFFYSAKAGKDDRWGTKHPTVKPIALMRWLVRLVTPPGGTILDPFAGSGTTGIAALREGFDCILIEREAQYAADIEARLAHVRAELSSALPLFAATE